MQRVFCVVLASLGVLVASFAAQQPPRKKTIEAPAMSCQEANRLAYRAVLSLGYTITSLQDATPGQPGHIRAKKEGTTKDGVVTITCSDSGAVVEPEKTSLPIPKLVGAAEAPGEFPQMFQQAFNILRSRKE